MHCLVPAPLTASLADVETVHNNECGKPLRIAHKLSETVLRPKSIKKVNVNLALSLLHESTINALKHYISLVDFDQRYSAYPTPTYPSDSVSVAKNSKDVTGKTKSARNFIDTLIR